MGECHDLTYSKRIILAALRIMIVYMLVVVEKREGVGKSGRGREVRR